MPLVVFHTRRVREALKRQEAWGADLFFLLQTAAVVGGLVEAGAVGLVTTHDLSLTQIADRLGARAANVHFADHFENGEMKFDYRLQPGVVVQGPLAGPLSKLESCPQDANLSFPPTPALDGDLSAWTAAGCIRDRIHIQLGATTDGPSSIGNFTGLGTVAGMRSCSAGQFAPFNNATVGYEDNVVSWPSVEPADDYTAASLFAFALGGAGLG